MTDDERRQLFKSIIQRRQIGEGTEEDDIALEKIQEHVDREAERLMPEVLVGGGTQNDAIKRACKNLGLPWEFFRK